MGDRIRTIWALSLTSMILLIGVQGYWLYNQYQYVVNVYSQELAEKIVNAGEKEFKIRNGNRSPMPLLEGANDSDLDSLFEGSSEKIIAMYNSPESQDKIKAIHIYDTLMSEAKLEIRMSNRTIHFSHPDSVERVNGNAHSELLVRHFSISPSITKDYINKGIHQAIINDKIPFCIESFDVILATDIPGIDYNMTPMVMQDSIMLSSWHLSGSLFSPYIKVLYIYSILENKGVEINATIPSPPLFKRMAVQLLLSLTLILLLTGCLILQFKTILKQKKINEMRKDFVNTMIHELNRPIQTLKTFISFLGNKDMRSDELMTEQVIQDSMFELDTLSAYLKKLKNMIQADNDTTSLQISRFDIKELIDKIVRLVSCPAEKDVHISTHFEMEVEWIEADMVHVANVVNNLIENAIKYSTQLVDIEVKAVLKERKFLLTVSDNGIGIPYSEQEKVFEKFYRGSNIPDKNIPGIGLGLSYVKLITEAHKGNVSLFSDIGKGTAITIHLPQ